MRKLAFILLLATAAAQTTPTANLGLLKPDVGSSNWGPITNTDWDMLDSYLSGGTNLPQLGIVNWLVVGGGAQLTTTNQTGIGSIVMSIAPTINNAILNSPSMTTPTLGASTATSVTATSFLATPKLNNLVYVGEGTGGIGDIGFQINAAYAAAPSTGTGICVVRKADNSNYDFSTPIVFGTANKMVTLSVCGGGGLFFLHYIPTSGTAFTVNWGNHNGNPQNQIAHTLLDGIQFLGSGGTADCIEMDGGAGVSNELILSTSCYGFRNGLMYTTTGAGTSTFLITLVNVKFQSMSNAGVKMDVLNAEAAIKIYGGNISGNTHGVQITANATSGDIYFNGVSFDSNATDAVNIDSGVGAFMISTFRDCHWETGAGGAMPFIAAHGGTTFVDGGFVINNTGGAGASLFSATDSARLDVSHVSFNSGTAMTDAVVCTNSAQCTGVNNVLVNGITSVFSQSASGNFNELRKGTLSLKNGASQTLTMTMTGASLGSLDCGGSGCGYVVQPGTKGFNFCTSAGGTTTYTCDLPLTALAKGTPIWVQMNASNTGASTLNVNGLGAKDITKNGAIAVAASDLLINGIYNLMYDGNRWVIVGTT